MAGSKQWVQRTLLSLAITGAYLPTIYAVPTNNLPSAALPESTTRSVSSNIESREGPQLLPPLQEQQEAAKTPLGKQAEKITFKLTKITLTGNHIYSKATLEKLYADKVGKVISIADLYLLAQNITNYYRNNGYILSRAILPPQHIKNGAVQIRVIEGYADKITVGGNPDGAKCIIQAYADHIKESNPLNLYDMEYYVILANQLPGCSAKAVLTPSKTKQGAADIAIMTNVQRLRGYLTYDNYGTRYIGPHQITGSFDYSSIIASGDNFELTVAKSSRDKELNYYDTNYTLPIFSKGLMVNVGTTQAKTHPMFVLDPLHIFGENDIYYASLKIPVIRERNRSYTITVGGNVTDVGVTITRDEFKLYKDHIRSIYFSNVYGFTDKFYGNNLFALDFRKGLPIFGYTQETNVLTAETSRPGGHAKYFKVNAQATRLQLIKGPFSVYGIARGQYAFNPLLASEQFVYGGNLLGRGYDPSEIIGDHGLAGSVEFRYDWAANKRFLQAVQFYAFYDAGKIINKFKTASSVKTDSATSTGIGARFGFNTYMSGNFMWTQPLTRKVSALELIGKGSRPRIFFSVQASWT